MNFEKELSEKISTTNFNALEESLEVSKDFFHKIFLDEFDWSLVIKLSVIIEAAVDRLLKIYFENLPEKFISKLNINGSTGKIQLLLDLNLITQSEKIRILEITKIRNKFAHRIEFIDKNIAQYYLNLNPDEAHNFFDKLITGKNNSNSPTKSKSSEKVVLSENALRMIFFTACIISLISITDTWQKLISENMAAEAPTLINQFKNARNSEEKEVLRRKLMNLLEKLENHPRRLIEINKKGLLNDSTAPKPSPAA
jgi:hypothetical protein